jgi:hypothetical protein
MKQKKVRWLIVFLLVFNLSGLQAQSFLNVNQNSGTQASFALSDVKKLIFTPGKMTVIPKTGINSDFSLPDILYLDFTNTTSVLEPDNAAYNSLKLYPNPVKDALHLQFDCSEGDCVQIQILDVQGKVLYQNDLPNQQGTNFFNIPVEPFRKGLYLCRLRNGNKLEISRFIKF